MDLSKLSTIYNIRRMGRNDVPLILDLENSNQLYFIIVPQNLVNNLY